MYGEPALWSAFTLRGDWHSGQPPQQQVAWLAATHILLRRVGHHVAAFSACGCEELERFSAGAVGLAHFLGLLHPSRLTKLSLHGAQLPDDAVLVAGSLSRLSALRLHSYEAPIPPCAASMLQQLPHLQHLQLDTPLDEDPGPTLRALAGLTGLTSLGLVLTTNQALHLQLPRLRHLNLYGGGVASGLASFPELESYQLARFKVLLFLLLLFSYCAPPAHGCTDGRGARAAQARSSASKSKAARRRVHSNWLLFVPLQLGCTGAVCVRDVHYKAGHLWFDGTWKLGDSIRRPLQPAVLNALLLPSCSRLSTLSRLDLSCCELEGAPPACPQLAGVAALRLCGCLSCDGMEEEEEEEEEEDSDADSERAAIRAGRGVSRAALSALLRQVPAATDLTIEECLAGDPAALDSSALPPGLTLLSLRCNELHQVPAGPYPSGEPRCCGGGRRCSQVPPASGCRLRCCPAAVVQSKPPHVHA